eukprot:gene8677-11725_t
MKFGEYLNSEKVLEWQHSYLDYDKLKSMIKDLEDKHLFSPPQDGGKTTSLSVPRPTNAAAMPYDQVGNGSSETTHEQFYSFLEQEMRKIEQFTKRQVDQIRNVLAQVENQIMKKSSNLTSVGAMSNEVLHQMVEKAGEDFLRLEKYVNLNFTGFHKILKKHDRRLPNPCRAFYTSRLHDQSWVRGDFSDVIVSMSRAYAALRGDEAVEGKDSEKQNFVRSTRKYWVHTENITPVKHLILQHLPVLLQTTMAGECDSQLVNSVYIDNHAMELYHGRLEKSPGAIALRFRWYGTGEPGTVFVERKTHRDSWAGELSVKERFTIKENQVMQLLKGKFDISEEIARLRAKAKSEDEVKEWTELATEICQQINSKQLLPTMRTQYMRTAFQIPHDATVRISLDTNLCMILDRTKDTQNGESWHRDFHVPIPLNEITRFPHAVLEIKLQLEDESKTPYWVTELIESGKLLEVHKFSKFIHGCAVLMPEDLRAVPYWIDDASLTDSINNSGGGKLLEQSVGANEHYQHLLPHDKTGKEKPVTIHHRTPANHDVEEGTSHTYSYTPITEDCTDQWCEWASAMQSDHITTQKVEPKLFFANERTFIKWLHMAVLLSSISVGVLAFSKNDSRAQDFAMSLLPLSLLFIGYALWTFLWRSDKIRTRDVNRWDDPFGPVLLTVLLILALVIQFVIKVIDVSNHGL